MISFTNHVTEEKSQPVFTDTRAKWKALAADRTITRSDVAARCVYLSIIRGEDIECVKARLLKAFWPITNKVKLDNGAAPYGSMKAAIWLIRYSTFYSWLTTEEKNVIWKMAIDLYNWKI